MDKVRVDRNVLFGALAQVRRRCQNKDDLELWAGDAVVLDVTNSSGTNICVKNSSTKDDPDVYGIAAQHIAAGGYGEIITEGPVTILRADGNANIAAGTELSIIDGATYADYTTGTVGITKAGTTVTGGGTTFTAAMVGRYLYIDSAATKYRITAVGSTTSATITPAYRETTAVGASYTITAEGRCGAATTGKGGAFATSLEAYTTNDCDGVLDAVLFRPAKVDSAAAGTLDSAYDYGSAGAGRAITVDSGAITMTKDDAGTENVLEISASPSGSANGDGILITCGGNSTGVGVQFANTGSGNDVAGTSDTWTISKAGIAVFAALSSTPHTLLEGTNPAASLCYIGRDNTGDTTINAITGKKIHLAVAGTDVLDVAAAAITLAQAVTISTGGLVVSDTGITITTGGLTVSASGATITGNSTITGDLIVTGSLTHGGATQINATLTVDELILDTDGAAPAATNCYAVRDNSGDLTLNAITGKTINLAIAGNDEILISAAGLVVAAANDIQFADDGGLLDSNGNEVILVKAVSSAINYLQVEGAVTANAITLTCMGTADRGFIFETSEAEEILTLSPVASALYNLNIISAASGGKPTIQTEGAVDIGIDFETSEGEEVLTLTPVATGIHNINILNSAAGSVPIQSAGANDIGIDFETAESEEMLELVAVASALYNIKITSAASATKPIIATSGAVDIGIDFETSEGEEMLTLTPVATALYNFNMISAASAGVPTLQTAGAADIGMSFETSESEEMLVLANIASAVDFITITSGDGTTHPIIASGGTTANCDLTLTPAGTGAVVINNGTDPTVIKLMGAAATFTNEIQDVNGCEILALRGIASAVCEIGISNAATGNPALVKAQGETNSNLMIDTTGTGAITIGLGGDEVLKIHDAAAMTFAAATDTAGHPGYIQSEDGGTDGGTTSTGQAGGLLHLLTGDGSAAVTTAAVGGAGGAMTIQTGAGAAGDAAGASGAGGALGVTAGAGATASGASGTGGAGGDLTLTAGNGGAANGGTEGQDGKVVIAAGLIKQPTQTIDMANNPVTTTVVPGTPAGTVLTANMLFVDANGGAENLLMPPEADVAGIIFTIVNTGGEAINVQNNSAGAIGTIDTAEIGRVYCDGTNWFIDVGVA